MMNIGNNSDMHPKPTSNSGMSRRKLLKYGLYGGLAAGLQNCIWLTGCRGNWCYVKPNVIIVSIDTLRADHLSCYGYKSRGQITPNIDKLASQGHLFSNAYTTIPTTLPAHGSLMSSLYPSQLGTRRNGEELLDGVPTLAEIFNSKGYLTAAFVSSVVLDRRYGLDQGFEKYDDVGRRVRRPAAETVGKTRVWLENNKRESFFLFVHLFDPHTPYYAPDSFRRLYGVPDGPLPPAIEFVREPKLFTPKMRQACIAAYDAEIAYADWAVGQLMEKLESLGLDENTIVVLVSDHGETLDELLNRYGYVFDHGEFLYAYELRIPMIVRLPKNWGFRSPGRISVAPVGIIDVMPTVLELAGMKPESQMMGVSLLPVLKGEKAVPRPIFSERRKFQKVPKPYLAGRDYSLVENDWHLIYSTVRDAELYNMVDDPGEANNLFVSNPNAGVLEKKLKQLVQHIKPMFGPSSFETDEDAIEKLRSLGYVE